MNAFIIQAIYGNCKSKTAGEARAVKWKSIKKKATIRLCPDKDSLNYICERSNYLAYVGLPPEILDNPSPLNASTWRLSSNPSFTVFSSKQYTQGIDNRNR